MTHQSKIPPERSRSFLLGRGWGVRPRRRPTGPPSPSPLPITPPRRLGRAPSFVPGFFSEPPAPRRSSSPSPSPSLRCLAPSPPDPGASPGIRPSPLVPSVSGRPRSRPFAGPRAALSAFCCRGGGCSPASGRTEGSPQGLLKARRINFKPAEPADSPFPASGFLLPPSTPGSHQGLDGEEFPPTSLSRRPLVWQPGGCTRGLQGCGGSLRRRPGPGPSATSLPLSPSRLYTSSLPLPSDLRRATTVHGSVPIRRQKLCDLGSVRSFIYISKVFCCQGYPGHIGRMGHSHPDPTPPMPRDSSARRGRGGGVPFPPANTSGDPAAMHRSLCRS